MILSQQNAANIQFLQQQMNDVLSLKGEFNNITNTINQMQQQMQAMMQQQSATFNQVSGGNKVVTISGTWTQKKNLKKEAKKYIWAVYTIYVSIFGI